MRQESTSRRKPYSHLFPLAASAVALCVAVTACDRPVTREAASAVPQPPASFAERPSPEATHAPAAVPASPPREALTDTAITGKIKTAILSDPGMAGADVSVNTDRGVVMLAGVVKTPEQTAIASAHAQRQDGVMRVDNHLSVPPT